MNRYRPALLGFAAVTTLSSVGLSQSVGGGTTDRAVSLTGQTVTFAITGLTNGQIYTAQITSCLSPVISCSSPGGTTFKAAGTTKNWNVNFGTAATPGTGNITLTVGGSSSGTWFVNVRRLNDVAVTPDGGTTPQRQANTGGYTASFTVTNSGMNNNTYNFSCAGATGVTCGTVPGPVAVNGLGNSVPVNMPYSVGAAGTGTLTFTATGTGATDPGSYNVPIVTYGVSVTPDGATAATRTANTGGYSESFTVTNTGSASNTFSFSCSGATGVTCGTVPGSVTLAANGQSGDHTTVNMPYSVGAAGTGTLTLTANGTNASNPGSYSVPIVSYGVSVTPDGATAATRTANTGGYSESFTVTNTGSASNTFSFSCGGANGLTCGTVPSPVTLAASGQSGDHTTVSMPYSVSTGGPGTLTLTASGTNASDAGSFSVPIDCTTCFVPSTVSGGLFVKDSRYLLQATANTYNSHGGITQITDARGKVSSYLWSTSNDAFLIKVTRVADPGSSDLVTDITYDGDGNVSSIKDEGGSFRYFTYDLFGRLRQIQNNAHTAIKAYGYTYSRTSPNWVFNSATPNAIVDTSFVQQAPLVTLISTQYLDGLGRPIQSVVRDGTNYHVTATQYDAMGRTWRVWRPYTRPTPGYDASFVTNATNAYNTYHSTSLANPYTETAYTPDPLGRVKQVIPEYIGSSPSLFVQYAYGLDVTPKQQYTAVTDQAGNVRRSYSDLFGNLVKTILGNGAPEAATTSFSYDVLGQRIQTTDPRGLNTTYTSDTRGLQTGRTSPDAGTVIAKHDKGGNVRFTQDANKAAAGTVYFTNYDFAARPLISGLGTATFSSLDPDAAPTALETTQSNWLTVRAYDAKPSIASPPWSLFSSQITPLTLTNVSGRLTAIAAKSNGAWQVTLFSYDGDGQVATRYVYTQKNDGATVLVALNTTTTYTRDLRGAVIQRSLSVGASAFYHWYDYDGRGLLWKTYASVSPTKPPTADLTDTYASSGQLQNYQFQGGPLVPIRYTIRGETERIGDPTLTTYPFSARYVYRVNGVVDTAEFYNAGSPAAQKRYRYAMGSSAYDALNRLKSADFSSWSGSAWTSTLAYDLAGITYDPSGNLLTLKRYRETGTLIDNVTYTNATTSNRLTTITDAVTTTPETWDAETGNFLYDANGNMTTAAAPYSITGVTYDAADLVLSITRMGVTTSYRYDASGQRIAKQVATGNTEFYLQEGALTVGVFTVNGTGAVVSSYFNIHAGNVIGRNTSIGARTYYHADILTSTRAVVNTAGAVVESYDFDPWGLLMPGRTLTGSTKEGFGEKEQDAETGLNYFGARYYMAALGRWIAADPLADMSRGWSPYNYVLNNPMALVDPLGLTPMGSAQCQSSKGGGNAVDLVPGYCPDAAPNMSPIYDIFGYLLGTDDEGLQGEPIIMDREKFTQGMSHQEAMKKNRGTDALVDEFAWDRFYDSYLNLDLRPDWDGYLDYNEAVSWYNTGGGQPLYVDARKIDLTPISVTDVYHAKGGYLNTAAVNGIGFNTGKVYGTIKFTLTNHRTGAVTLGGRDKQGRGHFLDLYDFKKGLAGLVPDFIASLPKGPAIPYNIYCTVCTNHVQP